MYIVMYIIASFASTVLYAQRTTDSDYLYIAHKIRDILKQNLYMYYNYINIYFVCFVLLCDSLKIIDSQQVAIRNERTISKYLADIACRGMNIEQ